MNIKWIHLGHAVDLDVFWKTQFLGFHYPLNRVGERWQYNSQIFLILAYWDIESITFFGSGLVWFRDIVLSSTIGVQGEGFYPDLVPSGIVISGCGWNCSNDRTAINRIYTLFPLSLDWAFCMLNILLPEKRIWPLFWTWPSIQMAINCADTVLRKF